MEEGNIVDFSFLDDSDCQFEYSVMIVLNSNFAKEQFLLFQKKSDFLIVLEEGVNEVYEKFMKKESKDFDPGVSIDLILGDEGTLKPEVTEIFKNVKTMSKNEEFCDLGKCLYYSLEKISEHVNSDSYTVNKSNKNSAIFILGLSDGRIDLAFSIIQNVNYYLNSEYACKTEFFMLSRSSMSVFLKNGVNVVYPSRKWENKLQGYSVVSLQEGVQLFISEFENDTKTNEISKNSSLVNSIFRKNFQGDKIEATVEGINKGFVMYSTTTIFHDL